MSDWSHGRLSRRRFVQGSLAAAALGVLTLTAAACGGGNGGTESQAGGDQGSQSTSNGGPSSTPGGQTSGTGSEAPTGGTLIYAQNQPITAADPINPQTYPAAYEANFVIYNNLVTFDPDLSIVPDLAEKWEISDDNLVWTFWLHDGVTFHDGTPFNAAAVEAHIRRIQNPESGSGNKNLWDHITTINVIDDLTIELGTEAPFGPMLTYLAHGSGGIESPTAVEQWGDEYGHQPTGTGPYKLESMTPGTELTLVRNDEYFKGTPKLDRIVMRVVPETGTRVALLEAGEASVVNDIPPEEAERLQAAGQAQVLRQAGLRTFFLEFNLNREIFTDVKVRHALNHAVDKEAIVANLFLGYGSVLDSPAAQTIRGHVSCGSYPYDPDRAKQLLAEAGWTPGPDGILQKDGVKMTFTINTAEGEYPKDIQVAEAIQANLRDVGCDVSIWKVEAAARWSYLRVPRSEAQYDTVLFGFNPSNGDLGYHMNALFHSNPDPDAAPYVWNLMWYANEEVDRLIDEAQFTTDEQKRMELLGQAQQIVWDDAPVIWLYAPDILVGASPKVQGVFIWPTIFTVVRDAALTG